jgi:hypothetical protein
MAQPENTFEMAGFPYIDPKVQHVGVSKLRNLNATNLSEIKKTLVIQDPNDNPLAVLLKYEQYLAIQKQLKSLVETLNVLVDPHERKKFQESLEQLKEGKTETLDELNRSTESKRSRG